MHADPWWDKFEMTCFICGGPVHKRILGGTASFEWICENCGVINRVIYTEKAYRNEEVGT